MKSKNKLTMIRNAIINYLKEKNIYDKVDATLIDEYIYNLHLADQAKADIAERGLQVNISKDPEKPYYQKNPSTNVYFDALKHIESISTKLSLSPAERKKLKLTTEDEGDDDLIKLLNG